jgi:hypothetical protein
VTPARAVLVVQRPGASAATPNDSDWVALRIERITPDPRGVTSTPGLELVKEGCWPGEVTWRAFSDVDMPPTWKVSA